MVQVNFYDDYFDIDMSGSPVPPAPVPPNSWWNRLCDAVQGWFRS